MGKRLFLLNSALVLLLAGCGIGGPSNAEAMEVVYGVYFIYPSILEKIPCNLTPSMEAEGHTNVWLIRYKFTYEGTDEAEDGMLISETGSGEFPWRVYKQNVESCP